MRSIRAVLLLTLALACGCAAAPPPVFSPSTEPMPGTGSEGRVVIRSGSMELRAKDLEGVRVEVERFVQQVKGWVENWYLRDDRWLSMTVRVPASELDRTMDHVATLGKVKSRSLRSQDVTEQLIDLEARLRNLKALRERLRSYLDQATDLKEILEVEKQLARVQTEIETIEARLKILHSQVGMSELDLTVRRKR